MNARERSVLSRLDRLEEKAGVRTGRDPDELVIDLTGLKSAFIDDYVLIDWDVEWNVKVYDNCNLDDNEDIIASVTNNDLQTAIDMVAAKL